ncbi:hypothetical protein JM949_23805 [Micromonospora sp. STR1s_6]|uniref:Uncharacterized protein n=1 Tax=Micromonospora tarensis TaxID=2806100 RepID=A0ABS1YL42_9ACTN|nr:hypothetical protein [Micromonospora tarensis]
MCNGRLALAVAGLGVEDFAVAYEQGRRLSPEDVRRLVRRAGVAALPG